MSRVRSVRAVKRLVGGAEPPVLVLHLSGLRCWVIILPNRNARIFQYSYLLSSRRATENGMNSPRQILLCGRTTSGPSSGTYTARSRDHAAGGSSTADGRYRDDDEVSQARAPYLLFLLREDVAPADGCARQRGRRLPANAETDSGAGPAPQIPRSGRVRGRCFRLALGW